jgi:hypothetical protein
MEILVQILFLALLLLLAVALAVATVMLVVIPKMVDQAAVLVAMLVQVQSPEQGRQIKVMVVDWGVIVMAPIPQVWVAEAAVLERLVVRLQEQLLGQAVLEA